MAKNSTPYFVSTGQIFPARITAANNTADGSGDLVPVVTGATDGTRVDLVRFINSQATPGAAAAKTFKIFLSDENGANPRIIGEVAIAAATRSTTAVGQTAIYTFDFPLIIRAGQILSVTQSVYGSGADQTDVIAYAGDYTA